MSSCRRIMMMKKSLIDFPYVLMISSLKMNFLFFPRSIDQIISNREKQDDTCWVCSKGQCVCTNLNTKKMELIAILEWCKHRISSRRKIIIKCFSSLQSIGSCLIGCVFLFKWNKSTSEDLSFIDFQVEERERTILSIDDIKQIEEIFVSFNKWMRRIYWWTRKVFFWLE